MNRLIVIGNGFDLAHGLPTRYSDFIEGYFGNVINSISDSRSKYSDDGLFAASNNGIVGLTSGDSGNWQSLRNYKESGYVSYGFTNSFFERIILDEDFPNWVDFEQYYYDRLLTLMRRQLDEGKFIDLKVKSRYRENVSELNSQFEKIRLGFQKYMKNEVVGKFLIQPSPRFAHIFKESIIIPDFMLANASWEKPEKTCILNLVLP